MMDEFLVEATLFEGGIIILKTFGSNIQEVVDNLVQLRSIKSVGTIVRKKDEAKWRLNDKDALTKLREKRNQIEDESLLRYCLSDLGEI